MFHEGRGEEEGEWRGEGRGERNDLLVTVHITHIAHAWYVTLDESIYNEYGQSE